MPPVEIEPAAVERFEPETFAAFEPGRAAQPESVIETEREQPLPLRDEPAASPPAPPAWKMEPIELPPDLVLVETRAGSAPAVESEPEERSQPRSPRPRAAETAPEEQALVQVETRKENEPANSNPA
jgi:hypothetical protein